MDVEVVLCQECQGVEEVLVLVEVFDVVQVCAEVAKHGLVALGVDFLVQLWHVPSEVGYPRQQAAGSRQQAPLCMDGPPYLLELAQ